jgi:hypothetical protein
MNKDRQTGQIVHKREGNVHANKALTHALGLRAHRSRDVSENVARELRLRCAEFFHRSFADRHDVAD